MPLASTSDGTKIHYEVTGSGTPLLFIHEFAGAAASWEPQVRRFSRRYRVVTYDARGYPPSDVPAQVESYSQSIAVSDAVSVLDACGADAAHVVGLSMGGFCSLHLALHHPERVLSAVVAGVGYGAHPDSRAGFVAESENIAKAFEELGASGIADRYAEGPARVQFQNKDPRGWAEFRDDLARHDALGAANTMRGVQMQRPSLYDLVDELRGCDVPILIAAGDEDEGCLEAGLFLKRTLPRSGFAILPKSGHTLNLEEPDRFGSLVQDFITDVDAGRWTRRDPRSLSSSATGMGDDD